AGSITLGVGQFCTNPGIMVAIESEGLNEFLSALGHEIKNIAPGKMLHAGIAKSYHQKKSRALTQENVSVVASAAVPNEELAASAIIATTNAETFINNPLLQHEVFGPYSIIVRCKNANEMLQVAKQLEGQLTCTLMTTENELKDNEELVEQLKNICGRIILNGVPTGVEVCLSMQHGGPFPASSDSRFTSVGADGIKRFARPIAFQNWSNSLLPDELKNENPLNIYRTVNNELSKEKI
ncbi:MAG: aldehyde dehydrogenase family protein, partial [Bacteroidota bacterium]